jgi:hypothetical protein
MRTYTASIPAKIRCPDLKGEKKKNLTNKEMCRIDPQDLPQAMEITEQQRASGDERWKRRQIYKR